MPIPRDHPHAYGDKLVSYTKLRGFIGSSPRVWGQDLLASLAGKILGIIPTRMGTSVSEILIHLLCWDHPHAYGDKAIDRQVRGLVEGSSPRVWGQVIKGINDVANQGIIPTRMGTRLKKSRKIAVLQNQPLRFPLTFHRSFV